MPVRASCLSALIAVLCCAPALAQHRQAPPGMFKELDDELLGASLLIHGKQLFIDDYVIEALQGVKKALNQPKKHASNPLLRKDKAWEFSISYGAVVRDESDGLYKMWYQIWSDAKDGGGMIGYAISKDGLAWEKPLTDTSTGTNLALFDPPEPWLSAPGVVIDATEKEPLRRYKMLYLAQPSLKPATLSSCVAYSGDGIHWKAEPQNPLIPYSDTQIAPFWDERLERFVAYCRFGPPNVRIISRIESQDFLHWSPKLTVVNKSRLDAPSSTELYTMTVMPYAGVYVGLLNTYHGETIQPIPDDKPWMDRVNVQLVFSRNGVTWQRVLKEGAISAAELKGDRDWKQAAEQATFIPYGEFRQDWDWGQIYPHHSPLVVGDEIRFYYTGISGRHWSTYHKDTPDHGVGLATLRLDGFVSVETEGEGTLTTKPLVFLGDTLLVNADAEGGSLTVEALDAEGQPIEGFTAADCSPLTSDDLHHAVAWKGDADCHLLQGRPLKLRFHLKHARLYSFEPQVRHNHYLQSYD